jgi:integrase
MTTERERHVIATRRRNKRGAYVSIHVYRPERAFKRTLAGTDPLALDYRKSLLRAKDDYARWLADGRPKQQSRRATAGDGMAITRGSPFAASDARMLSWLCAQFLGSAQIKALKPSTRARWEDALARVCALPWHGSTGDSAPLGDFEYATMRKEHVLKIRARFAATPAQADTVVKALRAMFYWGEEQGHTTSVNPAARLGQLWRSEGIAGWSYDDLAAYCRRWPVGSRERLALDLALYSGVRCCDLYQLGPHNLRNGWLHWQEVKGKGSTALKRRPRQKHRQWKAHAALLASIAATPHGLRHFIVKGNGEPFASAARLSESFRKWSKKAGVAKSVHGVRKLGAVMLADNDADLGTIRDFLGHTSFQEAETYIRNRDKRRASLRAVELLDVERARRALS